MDRVSAATFLIIYILILGLIHNYNANYAAFQRRQRQRLIALVVLLRRRQQNRNRLLLAGELLRKPRRRKRWQKVERTSDWWDIIRNADDERWRTHFRVSKSIFRLLCQRLEPALRPSDRPLFPSEVIPSDKLIAIAFYKMANGSYHRVIGEAFGVSKSSVHNCLYAFCYALVNVMLNEVIQFPSEDEAKEISTRFVKRTNMPQIIGAIDGSHIPITPPQEGSADFINRKCAPSFILQAVVDDRCIFRNISCKMPGACHDVDALYASNLFKQIDQFMPKSIKVVDGMSIPYMILGDPAYPLLQWLMKNHMYTANISPEKDSFNVYVNKGRVVVEMAFGRLKGRWRILLKKNELNYKFVPTLVGACCILHNLCKREKVPFTPDWLRIRVEDGEVDIEPEPEVHAMEDRHDAEGIRDHLTSFLGRNFPLLSSIRGRIAALDQGEHRP